MGLQKMKLFRILLVLPLLVLFAGCGEPEANVSRPNTHLSGGITFDYPKNWKVTEDSVSPEVHYLFVESPGDALVIFQSFPADEADALSTFSRAFSKMAAEEVSIGKIVGSTFSDMPEADGYEGIGEDFKIVLLGESVPYQRLYGSKVIGDRQVMLKFQVPTEDFSRAEPGFDLIRTSLRSVEEE